MAAVHIHTTPPRASSALLIKIPNLPTIEHPMARLGDKTELTVRGESRLGRREKTFVTMSCDGQLHLGLDRSNLPAVRKQPGRPTVSDARRILTWPPEHLMKPGERRKRVSTGEAPHRLQQAADQLENVIREKLTTGFYGLRHMFKGNDPNGNGKVSREALLRILYNLCGYISNDQYSKLMKRLNLDGKSSISFDEFIGCFKDNETVKKEWVSPVARNEISLTSYLQPEEHLRYPVVCRRDKFISSTFCYALIKDRAKIGDFKVRDVLPPACFESNGVVLPPQLRELAAQLGYRLRDEEFIKLWERFDLQGTGAVKTEDFFRELGLDQNGDAKVVLPPRPFTVPAAPSHTPLPSPKLHKQKTDMINVKFEAKVDEEAERKEDEPIVTERGDSAEGSKEEERVSSSRRTPLIKRRKTATVMLNSALDSLRYRCEENYQALLQGFQHFDFMKDGYIARIDFKNVLKEFGMLIATIDLEHFLSRCAIRTIRGQLNYKEFLSKYMNKSESGLVSRIASNQHHSFAKTSSLSAGGGGENLSVEELEARLVEFLHSHFLHLLAAFRNYDKYDIGVVTQYECKNAAEKVLGCAMTDRQWEELKEEVGLDADGLVPYTRFLDLLSISPGSWNRKKEGNHWAAKITKSEATVETERCREMAAADRERAAREVTRMEKESCRVDPGRSLDQLDALIRDLFRLKFHSIDKAFKDLDRKMTGRFNKPQFGFILKQCDCELKSTELDRIWDSLCVSSDGLCNYVSVVRHYVGQSDRSPPAIKDKLPMEDDSELIETARKVQKERKDQTKPVLTNSQSNHTSTERNKTVEREQLLTKVRAQVMKNADNIKYLLRSADHSGSATVPYQQVVELMQQLQVKLSEEEIKKMCQMFDLYNNGNFHYIDFMQTLSTKPAQENEKPSPFVYSKVSHKLEKRLIKDWKSIRRAFKKMDSNKGGYLNVADFKKVLKSCNISVTPDDLYHILAEFDVNMDGKISYEEFLNQLLNME